MLNKCYSEAPKSCYFVVVVVDVIVVNVAVVALLVVTSNLYLVVINKY